MSMDKTSEQIGWALMIFAATVVLCVMAASLFGGAVYSEIALTAGAVVGVLEFGKVRWIAAREL